MNSGFNEHLIAGISNFDKNNYGIPSLLNFEKNKIEESGESVFDTSKLKQTSTQNPGTIIMDPCYKKPEPVKDADVPTIGGFGFYLSSTEKSQEEAQKAYEDFSSHPAEEQEKLLETYVEAIETYEKERFFRATGSGNPNPLTKDEFLEKHPEFEEAIKTIEPLAREYNAKLQDAVNEWAENAKWYEKIGGRAGLPIAGREAAIENAKKEFLEEYPEADGVLGLIE